MIIKSMSRKEPSFGQLIKYIERETGNERYRFRHNVFARDPNRICAEFEQNAQLLKQRKGGVYLYHEIISITRAEDLSADIGSARRYDDGTYRDVFRFARVQTLLGAIAAGVEPLDTVYPDFRDDEGLARECREGKLDGFTAKMAIHPAQVPIINEVYTPSDEEVAQARKIVDAFEAAGNPGVIGVDGQMLDRPHLRKAEKLLARYAQLSKQ